MLVALISKEIKNSLRERTIASVILLVFFIAAFSSVITYGLIYLYNPGYSNYPIKMAIVGDCGVGIDGICTTSERAFEMFYTNKVDAIVIIKTIEKTYVDLILPEDDYRAPIALSKIKRDLIKIEEELRKKNNATIFEYKVIYQNQELKVPEGVSIAFRFVYLILIPLLCITTAIVAAGMVIDSLTEEFERGTIEILLASPLSERMILFSKIVSPMLVSSVLTTLWIALLILNGIEIHNPPLVFIAGVSLASIFILTAYIIALKLKDRERSQFLFSIIATGVLPVLITKSWSPAVICGRIAAGSDFSLIPTILTILSILLVPTVRFVKDQ
ncbi:MAG: ABC transporter permease subunit [Archaeoglobaceae archaeon]